MSQCVLCKSIKDVNEYYRNEKSEIFYSCLNCGLIFKSIEFHLSPEKENARYKFHQNDVNDPDYQKFLRPVVDIILKVHKSSEVGLDFGSGRASVIAHLLRQKKYKIQEYDPLFFPDERILSDHFDFITCTEVVEHFTKPREEFDRLIKLLKPKAKLYVKTALTDGIADFSKWYYHRDPTHVSFYNRQSLEYIRETGTLSYLDIQKNFIIFAL